MPETTMAPVELAPRIQPHPCRKCGRNLVHVGSCKGGPLRPREHVHCPSCRMMNPPAKEVA